MKLPNEKRSGLTEEHTEEITGNDATMDEAQVGEAGNGADPYGADFTGGAPRPIEDEPDERDISPDRIERIPELAEETDDDLVTARPHEQPPYDPSEL